MYHRSYNPADKDPLVNILRANTPKYFAPADEADFIQYLEAEQWGVNYTYLNSSAVIIGCASAYLGGNSTLNLSWAFFSPGSIGHSTIPLVIDQIISASVIDLDIIPGSEIALNTTQMLAKFLRRIGFTIHRVETNGYAPGYDKVAMKRTCAQQGAQPDA